MQLVFSNQALPTRVTKTLFLAGPSPRSLGELDWRHSAVATLKALGFEGTVLLPVPSYRFGQVPAGGAVSEAAGSTGSATGSAPVTARAWAEKEGWSYDDQVEWEEQARQMADILVFWVPRKIDHSKADLGMPGFTTNFEMGEDLHSGRLVYGRPNSAEKCAYLDKRVMDQGGRVHADLRGLLLDAMTRWGAGAERTGGEARVPLFIWQSESFQGWYANLKAAGNRLDDATLLNCTMVGGGQHLFAFTLKVKVWVEQEQRHKSNEVIVARKDVSAVFAFHRHEGETHLALVREFRSTVSNPSGFVYELAGGSCAKAGVDPRVCAQDDVHEELALRVEDPARFEFIGKRQLAATFSVHQASVYAIELNAQEFAQLKRAAASGEFFGAGDSEQTYVVTTTMSELHNLPVDFSTLGMVYAAAYQLRLGDNCGD